MAKSSIWPQIFAATSASLIFVCSGFHYGWPATSGPKMLNDDSNYMSITFQQFSWIVSSLFIGTIGGAFLGLILVDTLGRKITLLLMTVPFVLSCALIAAGKAYWWFILARLLAGIGVGAAFVVTPMYIGEIAEGRIRGGLCVLMPVMLTIGQLVVYGFGSWMSMTALAIVGAVIPIVFATALLWSPESPYYYAMKRNPNETRKSIAWLRGTPDVVQEVDRIHNSMTLRRAMNFLNLFTVRSNLKAYFVVFGLFTCQQLSATSIFMFLSGGIFLNTSLRISPSYAPIIVASIQLVTSTYIVFLTDKVGRRPLLLVSASFCAVFELAAGLQNHLLAEDTATGYIHITSWLRLVVLIGYLISYSIGLGPLPYVVAAEIFPCEVKAFALAIATVYHFIVAYGVSQLFMLFYPTTFILFYLFAACSIVSTFFIYFFVPETRIRSLSDIQVSLQGHFKPQF